MLILRDMNNGKFQCFVNFRLSYNVYSFAAFVHYKYLNTTYCRWIRKYFFSMAFRYIREVVFKDDSKFKLGVQFNLMLILGLGLGQGL